MKAPSKFKVYSGRVVVTLWSNGKNRELTSRLEDAAQHFNNLRDMGTLAGWVRDAMLEKYEREAQGKSKPDQPSINNTEQARAVASVTGHEGRSAPAGTVAQLEPVRENEVVSVQQTEPPGGGMGRSSAKKLGIHIMEVGDNFFGGQ